MSRSLHKSVADISPSDLTDTAQSGTHDTDEDDGKLRGNVIHRLLAMLTVKQVMPEESLLQHVADEFALDRTDPEFNEWRQEVDQLIHRSSLREFFDPACFRSAYNEIPVQYYIDGRLVYGIIDRLIVNDNSVVVIDYKTHHYANNDNLDRLAAPYCQQIRMYGSGIEKIWPDRPVRPILLFTACAAAYELDQDMLSRTSNLTR